MKKILLLAMFIPVISFAQETKTEETKEETTPTKRITLSGHFMASDPSQFGLSLEYKTKHKDNDRNTSQILNVSGAFMDYESTLPDVKGNGFAIELGSRTYIEKNRWDGLYAENFVSYGNIKFDENVAGFGKFDGTYSYWSIINPNVGYKILLGKNKNLSFDPYVGANWKWEVKGKGDVDNKNVDNFVFRAGIKIGYNF